MCARAAPEIRNADEGLRGRDEVVGCRVALWDVVARDGVGDRDPAGPIRNPAATYDVTGDTGVHRADHFASSIGLRSERRAEDRNEDLPRGMAVLPHQLATEPPEVLIRTLHVSPLGRLGEHGNYLADVRLVDELARVVRLRVQITECRSDVRRWRPDHRNAGRGRDAHVGR